MIFSARTTIGFHSQVWGLGFAICLWGLTGHLPYGAIATFSAQEDSKAQPAPAVNADAAENDLAIYDLAVATVRENFYDKAKLGAEFEELAKTLRSTLEKSATATSKGLVQSVSLHEAMNQLLQSLDASHTAYLNADDIEYYRIGSVFQKLPAVAEAFPDGAKYPSIGIVARKIDQHWWVRDVLPASSAEKAGLQIGDQLLMSGDQPFSPIRSLIPYVDSEVDLRINRAGKPMKFSVHVELKDPQDEYLQALNDSFAINEIDGRRIGYAHFYSYAGQQYQDALVEALKWGELSTADALVIDLRFGMGGADIGYLNMFQKNIPKMTMLDREGNQVNLDGQWRKPTVLLIDQSTRSGKETIAYGAKKLGFATVVGQPTAGAVVGGSPFPMPNGDLMYLAVRDVLVDGQRLEGHPTKPDIEVEAKLTECNGIDLQKTAALKVAAELVESVAKEDD